MSYGKTLRIASFLLRKILPDADPEFFEYLRGLDCSQVKVYGVPEGTIVFPRVPVLR